MRDSPWFPCYASNLLANKNFRMMNLHERGLWISIYMECWPNGGVPFEVSKMARYLGFSEGEIKGALTKEVMSFFELNGDNFLISSETESYRIKMMERRKLQIEGGKEGARRRKSNQASEVIDIQGQHLGIPSGESIGSLNHIKLDQIHSNQLINKGVIDESIKAWVSDYENAPEASSNDYIRVSRGG